MFDLETNDKKGDIRILEAGSLELTSNTATSARDITFCGEVALFFTFLSQSSSNIFAAYMNPGQAFNIAGGAFGVNGISKWTLLGRRSTREELTALFNFWETRCNGRSLVLAGHNIIKFDLRVLKKEMKRVGIESNEMLSNAQCIDTLELLRDTEVWGESEWDAPDVHKLGQLYEHVFGNRMVNAHTAMGDVVGNAELLLKVDPTLKFATKCMKPAKL